MDLQIAAYSVCALAGGTMFVLWRRVEDDDRRRIWRLYGWFSGLLLCGSCFGIASWSAWTNYVLLFYEYQNIFKTYVPTPYDMIAKAHALFSRALILRPVSSVFYGLEFTCMSAAKMMVLDRLSDFALRGQPKLIKRWGCIAIAVVILGNVIGLCSQIAASVFFKMYAEKVMASSLLYAANNSKEGSSVYKSAQPIFDRALEIESIQSFCEVTVLLLIIAAFLATGVLSLHRVKSRLLGVDASSAAAEAGSSLYRQILGMTVIVFAAFLLRSVLSVMVALGRALSNYNESCRGVPSRCDSACYNTYTHMHNWMGYTPEFKLLVVLVSSPLTLIVVLWGMTTKLALQLMKNRLLQ
jgi:hypothetical protein